MKIMLPALLAAALSATPAAAEDRRYAVTDFDRIVVQGPFAVRLSTGRPASAAASGSPQALERISIDVVGRTLRIRPNRSGWGGYPGDAPGSVTVEVTTRDLRAATVAGSGSLAIDRAAGPRLDLGLEGSGRLNVASVAVDHLTAGLLGSGRMEIAGRALQLRASVHGTGDLQAAELTAQDANVTTDSAGRVAIAVAQRATVNANGLGEVEITGSPACTVAGLGAAQVRCGSR